MKQIYLLNVSENPYTFEAEEKSKFLRAILDSLEVSYEDCFDNQSMVSKVKLKQILDKYNINIVDEESFSIFVDNDIIAKMEKPFYKIKKDITSKQRNNLYMEAEINFWSVYDDK